MKIWIATLTAFFSYSQVAAADQTPEQIQRLAARIALYPDAPIRVASRYPKWVVEAQRRMLRFSSLKMDPLAPWDPSMSALTQSPSIFTDQDPHPSPEVGYVPASSLSQVDGPPLMLFPGWVPIEGAFVGGPGISFGIGFAVDWLGGIGWGGKDR